MLVELQRAVHSGTSKPCGRFTKGQQGLGRANNFDHSASTHAHTGRLNWMNPVLCITSISGLRWTAVPCVQRVNPQNLNHVRITEWDTAHCNPSAKRQRQVPVSCQESTSVQLPSLPAAGLTPHGFQEHYVCVHPWSSTDTQVGHVP